jgi:hypothetical protein
MPAMISREVTSIPKIRAGQAEFLRVLKELKGVIADDPAALLASLREYAAEHPETVRDLRDQFGRLLHELDHAQARRTGRTTR